MPYTVYSGPCLGARQRSPLWVGSLLPVTAPLGIRGGPVPVPISIDRGGWERGNAGSGGAAAGDLPGGREPCERLPDSLVAHLDRRAQGRPRQPGETGRVEGAENGGVEIRGRGRGGLLRGTAAEDPQVQIRVRPDEREP